MPDTWPQQTEQTAQTIPADGDRPEQTVTITTWGQQPVTTKQAPPEPPGGH